MANTLFANIPTDGSGTRPLEADLYGAEQQAVDSENISATGNLNIGNVVAYDAHIQRYLTGGARPEEPTAQASYPTAVEMPADGLITSPNSQARAVNYSTESAPQQPGETDTGGSAAQSILARNAEISQNLANPTAVVAQPGVDGRNGTDGTPAAGGGGGFIANGTQSTNTQIETNTNNSYNATNNSNNTNITNIQQNNYQTITTTHYTHNETVYNNNGIYAPVTNNITNNSSLISLGDITITNPAASNPNGGNNGEGNSTGGDITLISVLNNLNIVNNNLTLIGGGNGGGNGGNNNGSDTLLSVINTQLEAVQNNLTQLIGSGGSGGGTTLLAVINQQLDNVNTHLTQIIGGGDNGGTALLNLISNELGAVHDTVNQLIGDAGGNPQPGLVAVIETALHDVTGLLSNNSGNEGGGCALPLAEIVQDSLQQVSAIIEQVGGNDILETLVSQVGGTVDQVIDTLSQGGPLNLTEVLTHVGDVLGETIDALGGAGGGPLPSVLVQIDATLEIALDVAGNGGDVLGALPPLLEQTVAQVETIVQELAQPDVNPVGQVVSVIIPTAQEVVVNVLSDTGEGTAGLGGAVEHAVSTVAHTVQGLPSSAEGDLLPPVLEAVTDLTHGLIAGVHQLPETVREQGGAVLSDALTPLAALPPTIETHIVNPSLAAVSGLGGAVETQLLDPLSIALDSAGGDVDQLVNEVIGTAAALPTTLESHILEPVAAGVNAAVGEVGQVVGGLASSLNALPDAVNGHILDPLEAGISGAAADVHYAVTAIVTHLNAVPDAINGHIIDPLAAAVNGVGGDLSHAVSDVVTNLNTLPDALHTQLWAPLSTGVHSALDGVVQNLHALPDTLANQEGSLLEGVHDLVGGLQGHPILDVEAGLIAAANPADDHALINADLNLLTPQDGAPHAANLGLLDIDLALLSTSPTATDGVSLNLNLDPVTDLVLGQQGLPPLHIDLPLGNLGGAAGHTGLDTLSQELSSGLSNAVGHNNPLTDILDHASTLLTTGLGGAIDGGVLFNGGGLGGGAAGGVGGGASAPAPVAHVEHLLHGLFGGHH